MREIIHYRSSVIDRERGVALLVVLFVIIAICIISVGFLSRCDVELTCGRNMLMRTQMDQLADSGLEHARGLLLHPQDMASDWTGATSQQLVVGSNQYYDVNVALDANDHCTYAITSQAYELRGGQRVGQSSLSAQLRLDPSIALWLDAAATLPRGWTVHGDVYCGAGLANYGTIDGDVFATALTPPDARTGRLAQPGDLSLAWPTFTPHNTPQIIASPVPDLTTYGPCDPPQVFSCAGSLQINNNVTINGMLLVPGNLTIHGNNVSIVAGKHLPALYVGGNLIIDAVSGLQIEGLAIVEGEIRLNEGATGMSLRGGLFAKNPIKQTIGDSTTDNYGYVYGMPVWEPTGGRVAGALRFDGIDDYIDVSNVGPFDLIGRPITVAAWIKVAAFDHDSQAIVTKGDNAWRLQRSSSTNCVQFAFTGISYNPPTGSLAGTINVNDGQWHHVAGVYDPMSYDPTGSLHNMFLYVDGEEDVSASAFGLPMAMPKYKVMIGNNAAVAGRLWNGWIDDVRIYSRALSAVDIGTIVAGGLVANPVAVWKLDEAGAKNVTIEADPVKAAFVTWPDPTTPTCWGPAAGAFFRDVHRNLP